MSMRGSRKDEMKSAADLVSVTRTEAGEGCERSNWSIEVTAATRFGRLIGMEE